MSGMIPFLALCAFSLMADSGINREKRPSSYPYITGDTFRYFCDWVIDEEGISFDPAKVKHGDALFYSFNNVYFVDYLYHFFTTIHPRIPEPYILVTHNSDCCVPGRCASFLNDPKLLAWFALNAGCVHPKLIPIPIGLVHKNAPEGRGDYMVVADLERNRFDPPASRPRLLYLNFCVPNNPNRQRIVDCFAQKNFCTKGIQKDFIAYMSDLSIHKFVLSPFGAGPDCHRTWEALHVGCIPIVEDYPPFYKLFDGLPVVKLKKWENITAEYLIELHQEIISQWDSYRWDKLYAQYWFDLIDSYRHS